GIQCPDCGGELVERIGKKGKFYGCANYPKCNFLSKYKPIIDKCPKCNTQMVLKELKKGNFKECPQCKFKEEVSNNE
ncbi:topoisomerase DNA-binding C4 zinc finger domain-containing protein, partial [Campylobacter lanienae]